MPVIAGIEDDPGVAEVLGQCVQREGWKWHHLTGGSETVEVLCILRPDIVTTGSRHPSLPGVELLEIMKREVALAKIPVVFVTPMARGPLWSAVRAAGLDPDEAVAGYVCKPFTCETLGAEIERVLRLSGRSAYRSSIGS